MTNTLAEAHQLHRRVQDSGRVFCLTHNYSGYPLVRQARAMVAQGQLGEIRLVQVEYVQGGRARPGPGRRPWKEDPARGGPSLVLGDIGTGKPPNSQMDQPFGASSQQSLAGMVLGKQVKFVSQAMDVYGRMIARLSVDGMAVNAEQIRRGMAWEYSHYHSDHALVALEAEARSVPHGLWAMAHPVPPWEWRKQHAHTILPCLRRMSRLLRVAAQRRAVHR